MALGMEVFNFTSANATTTCILNCSTSGVDRIVFVFVHVVRNTAGAVPSVSSVAATGLTFAKYASMIGGTEDVNINQRMEVWWAYAAAQQVANPVTVTISGAGTIAMAVGAISGLPATRFTAPFDADPSLPTTSTNPSATSASALETYSSHDSRLVSIAFWSACITSANTPSTPSGYTALIANSFSGAGFVTQKSFVFGEVLAAQQVNTNVDLGSKVNWMMMLLALGGDIVYPHVIPSTPGF